MKTQRSEGSVKGLYPQGGKKEQFSRKERSLLALGPWKVIEKESKQLQKTGLQKCRGKKKRRSDHERQFGPGKRSFPAEGKRAGKRGGDCTCRSEKDSIGEGL